MLIVTQFKIKVVFFLLLISDPLFWFFSVYVSFFYNIFIIYSFKVCCYLFIFFKVSFTLSFNLLKVISCSLNFAKTLLKNSLIHNLSQDLSANFYWNWNVQKGALQPLFVVFSFVFAFVIYLGLLFLHHQTVLKGLL